MPLVGDKESQYTPLHSHDESVDEEFVVSSVDHVWRRRFYILLCSSVSIIVLLVCGTVYKLRTLTYPSPLGPGVKMPYTPAPVTYVNKHISHVLDTSKFMGEPRPELDKAWHDLLQGTMIRLTKEELLLANNATSLSHKDGGYVGGFGVSHSLHCLKRIKQYLHPEYYYDKDKEDWGELYHHVDHCLESLRQQILCSADMNVYTLKWTPHSKTKPSPEVPQDNVCVDWDAIHEWMKGRAAKYDDIVKQPANMFDEKKDSM